MAPAGPVAVRYFADEAGDPVLFDRKGRVMVGREGCSKHFMVGILEVDDDEGLARALDLLRATLLADRYFRGVPSMAPEAGKTARAFHAKDDLPEIRREVFTVLQRQNLRMRVAVRRKSALLSYVRNRNLEDPAYRYRENELYDYMVRVLFRDHLHRADAYLITFAHRGVRPRSDALHAALARARENFERRWGKMVGTPFEVRSAYPHESATLQATDYCLWALQRLYERHEERFFAVVADKFSLIRDLDDTREKQYGVYYTRKRPLTLAALKASLAG